MFILYKYPTLKKNLILINQTKCDNHFFLDFLVQHRSTHLVTAHGLQRIFAWSNQEDWQGGRQETSTVGRPVTNLDVLRSHCSAKTMLWASSEIPSWFRPQILDFVFLFSSLVVKGRTNGILTIVYCLCLAKRNSPFTLKFRTRQKTFCLNAEVLIPCGFSFVLLAMKIESARSLEL